MNKGITVNQLLSECQELVKCGLGDKHILISCDDEGNGFHTLFYLFETDKESIQEYKNSCGFHDDNDVNEIVLLG